jgi:uncharacterized protein DUF1328
MNGAAIYRKERANGLEPHRRKLEAIERQGQGQRGNLRMTTYQIAGKCEQLEGKIQQRYSISKVLATQRQHRPASAGQVKTRELGIMNFGNLLHWAVVFLVVAIIAALLGFSGIAGTAMEGARMLFGSRSSCSSPRSSSDSFAEARRAVSAFAQVRCDQRPEMVHSAPDGLIGHHDPAFRQQIFDVAEAHPHGVIVSIIQNFI